MTSRLVWRRLRIRELLLLAALGALLAYVLIPIRSGRKSDPIGQHLAVLRNGSGPDRSAAATQLGRLSSSDAARIIPALIRATADRDAQVRNSAVDALHVVDPNDPSASAATDALITALQDPDPRVRATAAGVLSTIRPAPTSAIPGLVAAATADVGAPERLAAPGGAVAGPITAQDSIERSQRDHARASAVAALGVIGKDDGAARGTLVKLAGDPVPEVRMVVARTLGELGPATPGALAAELKLASDPDMYIQARAVTALGNFPKDYITSSPILYRAYCSKLRPLQEGAELSLEKIVASAAFDAQSAWHSKEAALRLAAVFSFEPGSEKGLQAIIKALRDEDPGVRILAVTKLCSASSRRAADALKALESLAEDRDADVRNQVGHSRKLLMAKQARTAQR
jgi:HEAT repeat protein